MPRHDLSVSERALLSSRRLAWKIWIWLQGPGRHMATVSALRFTERLQKNLAPRRLFSFPHLLVACWIVILLWGERWVFDSKVDSCDWENWEDWVRHIRRLSAPAEALLTTSVAQRHKAPSARPPRRPPDHRSALISWPPVAHKSLDHHHHR
jgi:hypothetical protein